MIVNKNLARLRNLFTNQMGKTLLSRILQILAVLMPKKRNLILFGSYLGERFGDNSGALFKYFIKYHKNEFRSIWLTDNKEVLSVVRNLGGEAYLKSSMRGLWLSIRTPLMITSYGVQDVLLYQPFKGYPNEYFLHHASAARKVVLNEKGGGIRDSIFARLKNNNIKYLAVISEWNGEFLRESFSLLPSQIKVIGFPRNDVFYENVDNEKEEIIKKLRLGQYNILYAPSWRKYGPVRFFPFPDYDIEKLACFLKENNMFIILRPHVTDMRRQKNSPFWDSLKDYEEVIRAITIDDFTDVQLILCIADCLITDFSSIHFDYLLLNRPLIYLPYDMEEYKKKIGGLYYEYEEYTPGPKPKTQHEFIECLDNYYNGVDQYSEKRIRIRDKAHKHNDGQSCGRSYEVICEMLK